MQIEDDKISRKGGYRIRAVSKPIVKPHVKKQKVLMPKSVALPPDTITLKGMVWCRHCQKAKINRPRGLCWACYYTPGVREIYPSTSKYSRRGVGNFSGASKPAAFTTDHAPGSPGKVLVMEARAKAGQSLFHPGDAGVSDPLIPELPRAA